MEATTVVIFNQAVIFVTLLCLILVGVRIGSKVIAAIEALARIRVSK